MNYGTASTKYKLGSLGITGVGNVESDGKAWGLLVEGDEADFFYRLGFSRGNEEATIAGTKLEADAELTTAYLGWHGLNLGEIGIGPAILYQKADLTGVEVNNTAVNLSGTGKTIFAGVLMRTETDQFDFTTAVGVDAGSDGWKNGTGLLIEADVHASDAFTLSGGWQRAWGDFENGAEVKEDIFSLTGRYRIADTFFVQGGVSRTNGDAGYNYEVNRLAIGVGATF